MVALFIITNENTTDIHQAMDDEMWYIHSKGSFLAIQRNELLIPATTWMYLENITLSEQSHK